MTQFLNKAKINNVVPKMVETEKGYILNGTYYDKKTFIPEAMSDLAIYGGANHLSLNRVANTHNQTTGALTYTLSCQRGDRLIKDDYEEDIVYIFTEDFDSANNSSLRYLCKYNEKTKEKINQNEYAYINDANWRMSYSQYLGQDKDFLYIVATGCHGTSYYTRDYIVKIDKYSLVGSFIHGLAKDRYTYSLVKETDRYIYIIRRCANTTYDFCEFDKANAELKLIKSLGVYTGEVDRVSRQMKIVFDELTNKGYIIDMPTKTNNTTSRWIDVTFSRKHPKATSTNGQPAELDLRKEISYTINSYNCVNNYSPCPLFTKNNHAGVWGSVTTIFYLNAATNYIDITFDEDVNIWRSGTSNYASYCSKFTIKKYNEASQSWSDITSTITQTLSAVNHVQWEKTISNLPAGRYRFEYGGLRMDSAWYLEKTSGEDYLTEEALGVFDPADIVVTDNNLEVRDSDVTLPAFNLQQYVSCTDYLMTKGSVNNYLHQISFCFTYANLDAAFREHACINTYRIDEENKKLIYTGSCPLSNADEACKNYAANPSNTRLVGLSKANTFIHEFDEVDEKFIPKKYFAFLSKAIGFDKEENIWILDESNQLLKFNIAIPESIDIAFENSNLNYEGTELSSSIKVRAFNYIGDQIESNWTLVIHGNARFNETGNKEINVTSLSEDALIVPITITGAGVILIYPVLNMDAKN